jgi:type IV secretory pathway VirB10-like protein
MTTRIEIIAHIDVELTRLQRARDFLAAALDPRAASAIASISAVKVKAKKKIAAKPRKLPPVTAAVVAAPPPPPPPAKDEPQVHRVPARRRMERRHLQSDKAPKSTAALSGMVPTGPVAVSANEARKIQERAAPPAPVVAEVRPEAGGERTLGSLIQAYERRAGLNGLETP